MYLVGDVEKGAADILGEMVVGNVGEPRLLTFAGGHEGGRALDLILALAIEIDAEFAFARHPSWRSYLLLFFHSSANLFGEVQMHSSLIM